MTNSYNDFDSAFDETARVHSALQQQKDDAAQEVREEIQSDPSMQNMESDVASGEKAGPTLEPSETEKVYTKYQDDSNVEIIDGKPFYKTGDKNAADVANEYTVPAVDRLAAAGRGVADTTLNFASALIPWLKPVDAAYDDKFGVETESDPVARQIRQISQVVWPTLAIGGAGANAIQGAAANSVMLGARQNLIGRIGFEAGISATVTAITDDTYTNKFNSGNLISDLFGVDVPWMHIDGESPHWTYAKNMLDDSFFSMAGGLFEAYTASRTISKHIAKNDLTEQYLAQKITPLAKAREELGDPVSAAVKVKDDARADEMARETVERMQRNAENPDPKYDPFLNEPHFPSERSVKNFDADVVNFKTDIARIAKSGDEYGARARPAVTEGLKKYIGQGDEFREAALNDFGRLLDEINVDTQIGGELITEEFKMEAVDQLLDQVANLDGKDLALSLKSMRNSVTEIRGMMVKSIGPDKSQIGQAALDRMMDLFSQRTRRASAVVAYQSGKDIADSALAINFGKGSNWTARQQEQLIQNIPVLMQEIRAQKFLSGYQLQMEKMTKNAMQRGEFNAEWVNNKNQEFKVALKQTREDALKLTNELYDISQENPDYFLPLYQQMARTNGEVNSLEALNKLMSKRMGFWKKAFIDGEPEIPSILVQEMQGMLYNTVLYGTAPINAGYDALQTTIVKPLVTLAGLPSSVNKVRDLKKSLYIFGGINETMRRAFKHAADEWRFALMHPDFAHARGGRADLDLNNTGLKDYDTMELMMKAWENDKTVENRGKLMMGSIIQRLAAWNRVAHEGEGAANLTKNLLATPRAGVNALSFVDGYSKSLHASFVSRSKAFEEVFEANNGVVPKDLLQQTEQRLYDSMFDRDGLLIDPEAVYLSKEANLNLDNTLVSGIESFTKNFPILRSLFMFPRTGLNYVARIATYLPTSPLGLAIGNQRKVLYAKTPFEKAQALKAHGMDSNDLAGFERLRQDYIGRQNMGAMIVTAAGLHAYQGRMTGKGPTDHNERARWQKINGWQPMSIQIGTKDNGRPVWWSYEGTQFETLLGLISDIIFHRNKVDEDASEWFRTLSAAVSLNVTNKTFFSNFEPLVAAFNGDASFLNRFAARNVNTLIPVPVGMRNAASRGLDDNLNDVKNHFTDHLAHMNRFMPIVGDKLVDETDIYSGNPIGHESPMIMDMLGVLPFGRISSDMEPWRIRLLESGWDNKPSLLREPQSGIEYTPTQRQFINHYVGTKTSLGKDVKELMMRKDGWYAKQIEQYKKSKPSLLKSLMGKGGSRVNYDWKKSFLYDQLNKMHEAAFSMARKALIAEDEDLGQRILLQKITNERLGVGDFPGAAESRDQLLKFNSTN